MALSPNYGWSEPDNSSLVKNGAADIRTLGDAIDTSLWNVGFGQAGKNKIINGDFSIWQRSTSATVTSETYLAPDRYRSTYVAGGATVTWSRQSFTAGSAPASGYEAEYFSRIAATSGSGTTVIGINQPIEDVRTFAGQTATFSFWAKADSARTATILILQNFGSGGSGTVTALNTTQALTTSWVRYSFTVDVPSISGKTVGTGSFLVPYIYFNTGQASGSPQLDIWGVQLEYGSKATPFETATPTYATELAACQRYYYLHASGNSKMIGNGAYYSAAEVDTMIQFPVTMRTAPTIDQTTGTDYYTIYRNGAADGFNSFTISYASTTGTNLFNASQVSGTAGQAGQVATNSASAYLGFSAEL